MEVSRAVVVEILESRRESRSPTQSGVPLKRELESLPEVGSRSSVSRRDIAAAGLPVRLPGHFSSRDLSQVSVLQLQRVVGNRAVTSMLRPGDVNGPVLQRQGSAPPAPERIVGAKVRGESTRTNVVIRIVGHASPRWRSATSSREADRKNARLSERRAQAVRRQVEQQLRDMLPNRDLVFEYDYEPADPLAEPADVVLGTESRGSTETLVEAGPRGRAADDPAMRRVELRVDLHSATETEVEEEVERAERRPGATTHWALWVGGQAGASVGPKAGGIMAQLQNMKTGKTATYFGHYSGGGAEVSVDIAKTSSPNFQEFETKVPMSFADFDGANFRITSAGISLGIGVEYSRFRFTAFVNGAPAPDDVEVSGITMGGVGAGLSIAVGALYLQGRPEEWQNVRIWSTRTQVYRSEGQETSSHIVLFETESATVSPEHVERLIDYLASVVSRSP